MGAESIPAALADVVLVDARTAAAVGGMSLSWWHERVSTGVAPPPVIRAPRCTRWRLGDVRGFWAEFAKRAPANDRTVAQATKASEAARARREAAQTGA